MKLAEFEPNEAGGLRLKQYGIKGLGIEGSQDQATREEAMKKALQTAKDFGAEGIKIRCAGRLGGAELARVEQYHWGRVPLHTLRANIDYGFAEANTVYGKLGIKCWICKGDIKVEKPQPQPVGSAN